MSPVTTSVNAIFWIMVKVKVTDPGIIWKGFINTAYMLNTMNYEKYLLNPLHHASLKIYVHMHWPWFHQLWQFSREKEEIWLSPMTEALTPTEKSKKQRDNTKNATKNFDYTTIADRLRTVSWGNDSHSAGVVKPVYGIPTFPLTAKAV